MVKKEVKIESYLEKIRRDLRYGEMSEMARMSGLSPTAITRYLKGHLVLSIESEAKLLESWTKILMRRDASYESLIGEIDICMESLQLYKNKLLAVKRVLENGAT